MSDAVVIVDDSLTVRMDLDEAFKHAGFEVIVCSSAREARLAVTASEPKLVVLDVFLPDGDGVDLLAEWRATPTTAKLPIILLSAKSEVEDRVRGFTYGADEYVAKPYDTESLIASARRLIFAQETRPAPKAPTVLVVDDSLTYREELALALRREGYRTLLAHSAEDGLERLRRTHVDAMIVDGVMPGMPGTALIHRVRSDPSLQATACLLLTASEGAEGEVSALDAGADAFVRKGEGTEVVMARLRAMLRAAQESRGRGRPIDPPAIARILAVDDSLTYLEELAQNLTHAGYQITKVDSGERALEFLSTESVDCVLLDFVMPGLSGTEVCRRIKQSPTLRNVPLVMLTSLDDQKAMIEGINAGADDYVTKSDNFEVLRARLRAQLRRKQFEDENRRIREEILSKETEARAARELAETRSRWLARLEAKSQSLEILNNELKMFAHSVSHDLRQPLRSLDGFSSALLERYADELDDQGKHYLERIRAGALRMGQLIDGLLCLSRVTTKALSFQPVSLEPMVRRVLERLTDAEPSRHVELSVASGISLRGDPELVESIFENLVGNAWKFTAKRSHAKIEVGTKPVADEPVYFVSDNGAGFDMRHAGKLFGPFQRLHTQQEFPGTGVGLATVQRIVHRHGGRVWAEGQLDKGACIYFTLSGSTAEELMA